MSVFLTSKNSVVPWWTMDADESGQSILEFIFMLPLMVGMAVILLRIATTIQISIVNQKYARSQALWLTFNSPFFPNVNLIKDDFYPKRYNKMVIGVSGEIVPEGESKPPTAATYKIARTRRTEKIGSRADQEEPSERIEVRVRNTVSICTQANFYLAGSGEIPTLPIDPNYVPPPEGVGMAFCRGPIDE